MADVRIAGNWVCRGGVVLEYEVERWILGCGRYGLG